MRILDINVMFNYVRSTVNTPKPNCGKHIYVFLVLKQLRNA